MSYVVDLRSDTVTKPTEAMKYAMVNSELGDDVYGEDPTVKALEAKVAFYMDMDAAVFVPSGTMANLIAIMAHCTKRGSEAIVGDKSHIFKYEQGGAAHVAGVLLNPIKNNPDGTFDLAELEKKVRGSDIHEPITSLVCIENTHNVCGGKVLPLAWIDACTAMCSRLCVNVHVDGARLMNASVAMRIPAGRLVRYCDSVSVCFSKGLGAPAGSMLCGNKRMIEKARRYRKMLGGGMRQAGVLAAAALVSLEKEMVTTLGNDHLRARRIANAIEGLMLRSFSVDAEGQETNIVLVHIATASPITASEVITRLAEVRREETQGSCKTADDEGVVVKGICFDDKTIRLTLHLDVQDEAVYYAIKKITYVFKELEDKHPY